MQAFAIHSFAVSVMGKPCKLNSGNTINVLGLPGRDGPTVAVINSTQRSSDRLRIAIASSRDVAKLRQ